MPRFRISPLQKRILAIAEAQGWLVAEHVYQSALSIPVRSKRKEPVGSATRAVVCRSLKRLAARSLLVKTTTGAYKLPDKQP